MMVVNIFGVMIHAMVYMSLRDYRYPEIQHCISVLVTRLSRKSNMSDCYQEVLRIRLPSPSFTFLSPYNTVHITSVTKVE